MDGSTSCIVALENFSLASSFAIDFLLKHPIPSMFHVGLLSAYVSLLHFVSYKQRQVCTPHENDSKSLNLCPHVFIFIKLSTLSDFFSNWFLHRIWLPWSVPWRTSRIRSSATLNAKWVTVINSCYFESILQGDWSKKIAPLSQLIRFRTKTNYVTGVFLRSRQFVRFRFDLLLASCDISFLLIGCDCSGFGLRHSIEKRSVTT